MPVTRETLFDEIWAEPMTAVAARHGVSSSFLTRVCERLNVPRPARGHWAKVKFGVVEKKPELPPAQPSDELVWAKAGEPRPRLPVTAPSAPSEAPERRSRRNVDVTKLHPLVFRIETLFENARLSEEGYLRPWKQNMADIFVSRPALAYAIDIANQLYQLLEANGHSVAPAAPRMGLGTPELDEREERQGNREWSSRVWRPGRATVVSVGTVAIGLTVYETSESVSVEYEWGSKGAKYKRTEQAAAYVRRHCLALE